MNTGKVRFVCGAGHSGLACGLSWVLPKFAVFRPTIVVPTGLDLRSGVGFAVAYDATRMAR